MPKLVNIRLFKDNRNYAGDVFVSVNGESYLIQRGVTVAVPAPAEGLDEASVAQITQTVLANSDYEASQLNIIEIKS